MDEKLKEKIFDFQKSEITEHLVYKNLSEIVKDSHNREVLSRLSQDELKHYNFFKQYSNKDVAPNGFRVLRYTLIARIFGLTFTAKLMELRETDTQGEYQKLMSVIPGIKAVILDEQKHEMAMIKLIKDNFLKYVSSIVLGLNDALVELTGALAGFTFALQQANLISMAGFITGVAASFSMGASEYLSTKTEEGNEKNPLKAALYTGIAYLLVVILLIAPFFFLPNIYFALTMTLLFGLLVIIAFSFYLSVAKEVSFRARFLEMASLSLGIAAITFVIGYIVRILFGIEM